ncbi:MAG: ribulose-phosphate 3-epimerase [Planctomycetaceae bacterium]|jgi:ribulose-phosphate 3-epimerase|nr:ribulose-phosphate 3-epimerase [Planctomycetaceae bacterium]
MLGVVPVGLRIDPSLLAADFANLESDIRKLERAGATILHLDIMDGHFVPNISFGVPVVEAIRRVTQLQLDVHLMLQKPQDYLKVFRRAGADILSIHIEVVPEPEMLFDEIRKMGALPGLVLNPPTPVEAVLPFLDYCNLILTMGVMPGFGGQKFQQNTISKIAEIKKHAKEDMIISVDGGISEETIEACANAGANLFVVGSALFKENIEQQFKKLSQLIS